MKRFLYEVYIIDPEKEIVLKKQFVFGADREEALIAADVKAVANEHSLEIKDVSLGVIELCEVNADK